jgi:hypothetical protein
MISENEIFSAIATVLRSRFTGIFVTGEYVSAPSAFPSVSIVRSDSYPNRGNVALDLSDEQQIYIFDVNVYSNLTTGKKTQCVNIMDSIASEFKKLGFTQRTRSPIPNADSKVYREFARFQRTIGGADTI